MHAAALPAAVFALVIVLAFGGLSGGFLSSAASLVLGAGGALLLYVLFSRVFRVAEATDLLRTVTGRLRR